jgi:hypothetical protein
MARLIDQKLKMLTPQSIFTHDFAVKNFRKRQTKSVGSRKNEINWKMQSQLEGTKRESP